MSKKVFYISRDTKDKNYEDTLYKNILVWSRRPIMDKCGQWKSTKNNEDDFLISEYNENDFKNIFKKSCRYGTCQKVELVVLEEFKK